MTDTAQRSAFRTMLQQACIFIGVASALAAIESAQYLLLRHPGDDPYLVAFFKTLRPWAILAALAPLIGVLARRFPLRLSRMLPLHIVLHLVASLALAIVHFTLLACYATLALHERDSILLQLQVLLRAYLTQDLLVYWGVAIAYSFVESNRALAQREIAAAEMRASLTDARLSALHAQLHPHFLFNALNTVAMQVRQGLAREATDMVSQLSELLREYLQTDASTSEVRFDSELSLVRKYLAIEQIRFRDRLHISYDIDAATAPALVPRLLLQPLVENAIKHGFARRTGEGAIEIMSVRAGDRMLITVADDGAGLDGSGANGKGLGLRNTRERLQQMYGTDASLEMMNGDGRGVTVRVSLPFRLAGGVSEARASAPGGEATGHAG